MPGAFPLLLVFLYGIAGGAAQAGTNSPPVWDLSAVSRLTDGYSEDTPVDTSLVNLRCTDPDGDRILYRRISGNIVRVLSNGTVYLNAPLDFEQAGPLGYDVTFGCADFNSEGYKIHDYVTITAQVSTEDANDQAPKFSENIDKGYSYDISESARIGAILTPPIGIRDLDRSDNAELSNLYFICNSPYANERLNLPETSIAFCTKFNISYVQVTEGIFTANITLTSDLDYETRKVYSSKIVAIDNPTDISKRLSTTINVQINIVDAQDVPPFFTNPGQSGTVREDALKGTILSLAISARDGDTGDKRPIALSIIEDPEEAFDLSSTTASANEDGVYESRVVVKNQLDREKILGVYRFVVKATELDKVTRQPTPETATATYSVFVVDVDDNPPEFEQPRYEVNIPEIYDTKGPVQITGLRIVCRDPDERSNAQYRVSITSQPFGAFSISPDTLFTGTASMFLTVDNTDYLDYDVAVYRTQTLVLEAKEDVLVGALSSSCTVVINLTDVNDNVPEFEQSEYVTSISESANQFPSVILTVKATDKDSGTNSEIRYSLESGLSSKFSVNSTSGELSLLSAVDYEEFPEYIFLIYASDQAVSARSSQAQVTVKILNFNDLGPKFRQASYQASVNENSLAFLTPIVIQAVDDEDDSKPVTYEIVSDNSPLKSFVINSASGIMSLRSLLSYEGTPIGPDGRRTGKYTVLVEASDNGDPPQTNQVSVTVTVIDQNNYPPVLNPKIYQKDLSELAAPGTFVAKVLGTDQDSGAYGTITYRIGPGGFDNFIVNPTTGVVTVNNPQNFDYDEVKFYTVKIIASDGGAPQRSATATIQVQIEDANNKRPTFLESIYTARVDENSPIGTTVLTVEARDSDSNSLLIYSIQTSTIAARSADGALLTSTADYDYKSAFAVHNTTGVLYVNGPLNKEKALEINFQVQVRDVNAQTDLQFATTRVSINMFGEINDQIYFEPVRVSLMNEDRKPKYDVVTVVARDPLSVRPVTDYVKTGGSDFFDVERVTGIVQLIKEVDYDKNDAREHRVQITAYSSDRQRSAAITVVINIVDVNDNAPQFQRAIYYAEISENARYPASVTSVIATDEDSASFGPIFYRIAGGLDADDFILFPNDPGVSVLVAPNKKLDYNRRSFYDLDIVAGDNENTEFSKRQLFSTAKLEIKVLDENNNVPQFVESKRIMAVAETATIGHQIGTILATDNDFGQNGAITYALLPASGFTGTIRFQIHPTLGIVSVARSLLGLGAKKYYFTVQARDGGLPPNYSTMNLEIEVLSTEDNDGNPLWLAPPFGYVVYAPEETSNYVLKNPQGNVEFFDVTARTGSNISYAISQYIPFYSSFQIDPDTGKITIVKGLDREVQEDYSVYVYAQDTVNPTKIRTGREIIVRLTDTNDNEPTFTNPKNYITCGSPIDVPLKIYVRENTPANVTVYTLKACDPDGPNHNKIYYYPYTDEPYCKKGLESSGLTVEKDGSLVSNRVIDYEQNQDFIMCILASSDPNLIVPALNTNRRKRAAFNMSQLSETRHDVAYIHVIVVDENDNGPQFPSPVAVSVIQTIPEAGPVYVLNAVDLDGRGKNVIEYLIESILFYPVDSSTAQPSTDVFIVTKDGNAVYPSLSSYKKFSGGRFALKIVAIDKNQNSYRDVLELKIFVYEKGQAMKVILNIEPQAGYSRGQPLVDELNTVSSNYAFTFLQAAEHRGRNGINFLRTDVCFLAVNVETNTILNVRETIDVLDQQSYRAVLRRADYQTLDRGRCYPSQSSEEQIKWRNLWWVLVAVAVFLFVYILIFIIIISVLYSRYKRYMKTRKTYLVQQ